ncbi:hypothetical protein O1611_g7373 [Lasiodiplodia mahajangana]|uniref:Uncharacterized protein n=1 Tax=Lasiodiplodia mahajangana TaxID=1108764 RepID=A0ACC2JGB5_9PEZI|nr:hypothetical protein O1611_g7373 [Lasiodiplodia mahajangana]
MKPILVYTLLAGPNPWKVIFILEELRLPYEIVTVEFANVKKKPFTDINPNGRCPAIIDPNTNLTLWESGAIVQYIIDQYDTKRVLTYDTFPEKHHLNQWLQFQMSGQGPYYGQASWYNVLQDNPVVPEGIKRYNEQLKRVLQVLDGWLEGRQWLVGDKMTYADMAFVPWNDRIDDVIIGCARANMFEGCPNVQAWHERMTSRHTWKKIMEDRRVLMEKAGIDPKKGRPAGTGSFQEYEAAALKGNGTDK